ncbi:DUF512 domain-containing protein [candidate division WOR-3 bacterium]|nr:DUF512 domain-containing protein [candidate division WOR-3 bacterium]
MGVKILKVSGKGLATELGILPGDEIVSINGKQLQDYFDLSFWISDYRGKIVWKSQAGKKSADLGGYTPKIFGAVIEPFRYKRCANKCVFCFVDQNPKNSRKSLKFKDDDYRLSFLSGAYITGTNLTEKEIMKITELKLSPIYISVHATDPLERGRLFGLERGAPIVPLLKKLVGSGIKVHTQIVIVPGMNDGNVLEKTLEDLVKLKAASVALVPVGLTKYRKGLTPLREMTKEESQEVIGLTLSATFRKKRDLTPLYPTDQMFLKANVEIPGRSYYTNFPQLENGVGGLRLFIDRAKKTSELKIKRPLFILTGIAMAPYVQGLANKIFCGKNCAEVVPVKNRFYGGNVDTAALLSGRDLKKALENLEEGIIGIPARTLNHEGLFVDGLKITDIEISTGRKVFVCPENPRSFFNKLDKSL